MNSNPWTRDFKRYFSTPRSKAKAAAKKARKLSKQMHSPRKRHGRQ